MTWDAATTEALRTVLRELGKSHCACGHEAGPDDVTWGHAGQTEAGTEYGYVAVTCPVCQAEIVRVTDWSEPETAADATEVLAAWWEEQP